MFRLSFQIIRIRSKIVYGAETGSYHGDGDPRVIERFPLHDHSHVCTVR